MGSIMEIVEESEYSILEITEEDQVDLGYLEMNISIRRNSLCTARGVENLTWSAPLHPIGSRSYHFSMYI